MMLSTFCLWVCEADLTFLEAKTVELSVPLGRSVRKQAISQQVLWVCARPDCDEVRALKYRGAGE